MQLLLSFSAYMFILLNLLWISSSNKPSTSIPEIHLNLISFTWVLHQHKSGLHLLQGLIVLSYVPSRQWDPQMMVTWYLTHPLHHLFTSRSFSSWTCRKKVGLSTINQTKSGVEAHLHQIATPMKTTMLQWNSTTVCDCSTAKQINMMQVFFCDEYCNIYLSGLGPFFWHWTQAAIKCIRTGLVTPSL